MLFLSLALQPTETGSFSSLPSVFGFSSVNWVNRHSAHASVHAVVNQRRGWGRFWETRMMSQVELSLQSTDESFEDEARRAMEDLNFVPSKEVTADAVKDELFEEMLSQVKEAAPSQDDRDLRELLRESLDEEFEKAAIKLALEAENIKNMDSEAIFAENRSKIIEELVSRDEERLREGEKKVTVLVDRVKREEDSVREAIRALEEASEGTRSGSDPLYRVASFRDQPLGKQAALTAAVLFAARAGSAIIGDVVKGGGNDGLSIAAQAGLAFAAAVIYFI